MPKLDLLGFAIRSGSSPKDRVQLAQCGHQSGRDPGQIFSHRHIQAKNFGFNPTLAVPALVEQCWLSVLIHTQAHEVH
jgi:hypothetical protein